jgi:hypothetical protein
MNPYQLISSGKKTNAREGIALQIFSGRIVENA